MKISELILLLRVVKHRLGDCDVHVEYQSDLSKVLFEIDDIDIMKSDVTCYIALHCDQSQHIKLTKNEIL